MKRAVRRGLRLLLVSICLVCFWGLLKAGLAEDSRSLLGLYLQGESGSLAVPVDGVRSRDLRDTFGAPRSGGRRHEGIDILAPKGTPVRSTFTGLVWRVGVNRLGGNVVWVLGPGGQWHYFAHLERFAAISRGQFLMPGDLIGFVGDTGNARGTPPHLHYGIYHPAGAALNPYHFLVSRPN